MAILASAIVTDMEAALDAEGSDYYTFPQDYCPAINRAVDFIVSVFNKAFAENKLSEENLRELIEIKLYQLSSTSTLTFDAAALADIWSIYAVYPTPRTIPATITPLSPSTSSQEYNAANKFAGGEKAAKRKTLEQWATSETNPFEKGNTIVTSTDLVEYAYLSFSSQTGISMIIRPELNNGVCAVAFLNYPTAVTTTSSSIPLPLVLKNMITAKALMFIAEKQGDNTTLFSVADKDVKELITLLN